MITNPQAIKICNERFRPACDRIAGLYTVLVTLSSEFDAKGLADIIPDDSTVIDDGAATDGRTPMTGHDVHQIIALAHDLISMGTGQNTKMPTVLKVAVNPGTFGASL